MVHHRYYLINNLKKEFVMVKFFYILSIVALLSSPATFAQQVALVEGGQVGAVTPAANIPKSLTLWMYPERLNRRGHQLDIDQISISGASITAKATMHGRAKNRCVVKDHPLRGTLHENGEIQLLVQVNDGDNLTCKSRYVLVLDQNGALRSGKYFGDESLIVTGDLKAE